VLLVTVIVTFLSNGLVMAVTIFFRNGNGIYIFSVIKTNLTVTFIVIFYILNLILI